MSRVHKSNYSGPKLPRGLFDRVNGGENTYRPNNPRRKPAPTTRKEKRKAERQLKKPASAVQRQNRRAAADSSSEPDSAPEETNSKHVRLTNGAQAREQNSLKHSAVQDHGIKGPGKDGASLNSDDDEKSLPTSLSVPKQSKQKLQQDDAEIAALEKRLRIKSKKLPQSFYDDGLGDLVGDLGEEDSDDGHDSKKKKSKSDLDWLASKRQRFEADNDMDEEGIDEDIGGGLSSSDSEDPDGDDDDNDDLDIEGSEEDASEENFDGFDSDSAPNFRQKPARVKENPYIPPVSSEMQATTKYTPPSHGHVSSNDVELQQRLQRKTKGLLNRLAESNLVSILSGIEELYQENPRQYVTSTLVDLLLTSICDHTSLPDNFIILNAGFITALYKVMGPDFGAHMIESLVTKIDQAYPLTEDPSAGKECVNMISLLARLFNFQFITCDLIFDYIRIFLQTLSETNAELLLRVVRTSGQQLRQDDPASLKDIVQLLQKTVATSPEGSLSVRTRFMIDTIEDLKNNKLKAGASNSAIAAEKATQMKKTIGSLNARGTLKATEPLHISLEDIRTADKRGKWWLVGAKWRGKDAPPPNPDQPTSTSQQNDGDASASEDELLPTRNDIHALAQANNMNTPLRRQIFAALLTSTDYRDAQTKLLKLSLTRSQQHEIPRILLHCASTEQSYNPYYTLIAARLCASRAMRMGFQFCLWDFFKKLGVRHELSDDMYDDDDDADEQGVFDGLAGGADGKVPVSMRVNYARLYGRLIAEGAQSIRVLKPLDLGGLSRAPGRAGRSAKHVAAAAFVEMLLVEVILRARRAKSKSKTAPPLRGGLDEDGEGLDVQGGLEGIFAAALGLPELRAGLKAFVKRVVRKSDLVQGEKETKKLRERCRRIAGLLEGQDGLGMDDLEID